MCVTSPYSTLTVLLIGTYYPVLCAMLNPILSLVCYRQIHPADVVVSAAPYARRSLERSGGRGGGGSPCKSPSSPTPTITSAYPITPNLCVTGGKIEFITPPGECPNVLSLCLVIYFMIVKNKNPMLLIRSCSSVGHAKIPLYVSTFVVLFVFVDSP